MLFKRLLHLNTLFEIPARIEMPRHGRLGQIGSIEWGADIMECLHSDGIRYD